MSVEERKGRLYWYARRRVGGRVRAAYHGPLSAEGADLLRAQAADAAAMRAAERREVEAVKHRAAAVLAAGWEFDRLADRVFRAVMHQMGYRCHHRGEWRRTGVTPMGTFHDILETFGPKKPTPGLIRPVTANAEHQQVLDRATAGDPTALPDVRELLTQHPGYAQAFGSVSGMAAAALVVAAAGEDVTIQEAVLRKLEGHVRELLAGDPDPAPLPIRMAATRVAHGWVAVHILETMVMRHKLGSATALAVERQLASAERRLQAALRALEVLRRLRRPVVQVNVANGPMLVTTGG